MTELGFKPLGQALFSHIQERFPNRARRGDMGSWCHGSQPKVYRCCHAPLGQQEDSFIISGGEKMEESSVGSYYKETVQ